MQKDSNVINNSRVNGRIEGRREECVAAHLSRRVVQLELVLVVGREQEQLVGSVSHHVGGVKLE